MSNALPVFIKGECKTVNLVNEDGSTTLTFQRGEENVFVYLGDDFAGQIEKETFDEALTRMLDIWSDRIISHSPLSDRVKREHEG
jgi:hypothetical protein